jgi:GMP synthase-like glutamine amidotransferase
MRLTILETGRPPAPVADAFPRYPAMVEAMLSPLIPGLRCETVALVDGEPTPAVRSVEAVLITGSPVGVYDPVAWIAPLKTFIVALAAAGKPQVGICFGHQIMAEAFGGRAAKAPQGWGLGRHSYQVARHPRPLAWHREPPASLGLAVSHQDQVLEKPPTARVLAHSDFTPFAALAYEHAPALSFQGHPEFCPRFAAALIRSRRGTRFTESQADQALESLEAPLDGAVAARWMADFYSHALAGGRSRRAQPAQRAA